MIDAMLGAAVRGAAAGAAAGYAARYVSQPRSKPVYTVAAGPVTFTVVQVNTTPIAQSQLYAVQDRHWELVGFGLYTDMLATIDEWRGYLAQGGTLAAWRQHHPDGAQGR